MLTRSFLPESQRASVLAYSPMLHARLFTETQKYRDVHFQATVPPRPGSPTTSPEAYLDGNRAFDRPLIVQFCANDPSALLEAAKMVAPHCDAVDLNLGCPQGIARKGHYGAFLQEDQDLIYRLINTLHENLPIPVTAKIRILDTPEATLAYAMNVLSAGASFLTVHGRRREQKGHLTGLADWSVIRFLRERLPKDTVLFANGNILQPGDLDQCLETTGADGVMSAEGNLSDPGLFAPLPEPSEQSREYWRDREGRGGWRLDAVMRRYFDIIHTHVLDQTPADRRPLFMPGDDTRWLEEYEKEKTATEGDGPQAKRRKTKQEKREKRDKAGARQGSSGSNSTNIHGMRAHLFHLLRHLVSRHHDVRDTLARTAIGDMDGFEHLLGMVEAKIARGLLEYERTGAWEGDEAGSPVAVAGEAGPEAKEADSSAATVARCRRAWWVAQPIVRPLPQEAVASGAVTLDKKGEASGLRVAAAPEGKAEMVEGPVADTAKRKRQDEKDGVDRLEETADYQRSELVSG
jgi:tRNA-dihydrouridine synthase 1